jgi:zinc transport system substrate-binding protein
MNTMKKTNILLIGSIFCLLLISSGCIQNKDEQQGIKIVASFYPLAYFAEEIGGEYVSVTQLIPNNTEIHGWQPSVANIITANQADILIYNGAGLDHWFEEDILTSINQSGKTIIETTKDVQLLENSNEAHEGDHEEEHDEHEHGLYDPHTWICPYIAQQQAEHIYLALIEKDPVHQEYYTQRWNDLEQRFKTIDNAFKNELSSKKKDIIIVNHAAFGYLANRYGFHQHGVIGLSADEQPSASTIASLISIMIEHNISTVYVDPVYSDNYAQTLKSTLGSETGQNVQILTLYLMSGTMNNMDYFEQLEKNLENLKIGLQAS